MLKVTVAMDYGGVGGQGTEWQFQFHSTPITGVVDFRDIVTMEWLRKAELVTVDGKTVKDRWHAPDRALTYEEFEMVGPSSRKE